MSERDDWLAWRRDGIGASDVAAILGISPWASQWSVWADKAGLLPPQPEDEYMAAGRWLEAAIGPWFTHETGLSVAGEQTWCTHHIHEHHRCTVDGFVLEGAGSSLTDRLGVLEIKVTGPGRRWDPIPEHYEAQAQWQMHVTDSDNAWLAVLMGRRLDVHELARDDADIDFMAKRVDEFWADHVLSGTPPAIDGTPATARALAAVYPEEIAGSTVELSPGDVTAWVNAKADRVAVEACEKTAANQIRAALGDAETGNVEGRRAVTLRAQTRKTTCKHCGHVEESDPYRVLRYYPPKETP